MLGRNDYYVEILDYPKEELFSIINKCTAYLLHMAQDELKDKDTPYEIIIDLVFMYAFHDGYVTPDKIKLVKELFDLEMNEEDLLGLAGMPSPEKEARVHLIDKLRKDDEFTDTEFLLAICIYALDGEITREEQAFVERNTRQDIRKQEKGDA